MNIFIAHNSMTMQGKIGEILAWLEKVPGEMLLQEYIRLSLH